MIGVRFIALNDGVDTLKNDNDIMPFKNLFNEFQNKETSRKIKAVRQANAKVGNYLGAYVPYGYMASPDDKHKFIIDEPAAENVRKLFRYRCMGYGYRKIAGLMNQEHILPPKDYYYLKNSRDSVGYRNHLWNDVTVKKILRNEVYIGHMVQNKTGTVSYKNQKEINKPQSEWIKVENTHEPIIDMETWNACIEIEKRTFKPRTRKYESEPSLFGGLLVCMDCGFKMRYSEENHIRKNGRKVKYISYMCGNYSRSGKAACSAHIMYQQPLTEIVLEDIRSRAKCVIEDENAVRKELTAMLSKRTNAQKSADTALLHSTQKRLSELDRLIQSLYEDKVLGNLPETVFKELIIKYNSERSEKQKIAQQLIRNLSEHQKEENNIEQYMEKIRRYVSVKTLNREMLLELIKYIEIGERKQLGNQKYRDIVIHYNLIDISE